MRQYCRYSGEIKTGRNIKQMVARAVQLATSDPKGPAYLMAAREVLEEVFIVFHISTIIFARSNPLFCRWYRQTT